MTTIEFSASCWSASALSPGVQLASQQQRNQKRGSAEATMMLTGVGGLFGCPILAVKDRYSICCLVSLDCGITSNTS